MAIRFDKIQLTGSNTNHQYPQLWNVSGQKVTIQSSHGYVRLGSDNSSYGHIETDRASFYFNKAVSFDGNIASYSGNASASFALYYDSQNTAYYVDPNGASKLSALKLQPGTGNNVSGDDNVLWIHRENNNDWGIQINADQGTATDYGYEFLGGSSHTYAFSGVAAGTRYFQVGSLFAQHSNSFRAPLFYDSDNTNYYTNPAATSVMNNIEIEDYIYHKGDTNTYLYFETDSIKLRTGGTDRLTLTNSSATFANNVRIPVAWDSGTLENNAIYAKNSTDGFGMGNGTGISTWWAWSTENGLKRMIDCANSGDYVTLRTANTDRVSITSSGLSLQNSGDIDVGNIRIVGDNDSSDQGKAWMRSNGDYLVLNAVDGEHVYLNWDTGGGGSGHVYVQDRVYAMSFFDRNDTNYYLDPNGQSRLHSLNLGSSPASGVAANYIAQIRGSMHMTNNPIDYVSQLHFNDNVRFYQDGNNNYLNFKWGSSANGGIVFRDGDGVQQGMVYGSGNGDFGLLDKDGHWTLITNGSSYTALRADNNEELIIYNNRVEIPGDIRAPYFYDRDDTNYYVNPAGTTIISEASIGTTTGVPGGYKLNMGGNIDMNNNSVHYLAEVHFQDNVRFLDMGNDSDLQYKFGDASLGRLFFHNGSGAMVGGFQAESGYFGTLSPDNTWAVQSSNTFTNIHHYLNVNDSIRTPIYYDKDDTSYYADFKSASRAIRTYGSISLGTVGSVGLGDYSHPKIVYPGKEASWDGSGNTTGQVVIDLPGTLAHYDMMYMEIHIYEYSSQAASKIIIGGHNWNSGGTSNTGTTQWYNNGVQVIGAFSKPIYLGRRNDGTSERRCIALGDTTSTWSYGTVHVAKVHGACYYTDSIDWLGDWNVAQTTSGSYFTANPSTNWNASTATTLKTSGRVYANYVTGAVDVRSPIYYDSNDTNYYINPASTSLTNVTSANNLSVTAGNNNGLGFWGGTSGGSGSYAIYMSQSGGSNAGRVAGETTSDYNMYFKMDGGTNRGFGFKSGSTVHTHMDASGHLRNTGSVASPIYYDSNNTSYYLDPASTSTGLKTAGEAEVKSLRLGNGFTLNQGGSTYAQLGSWIDVLALGFFSSNNNGAHLYPNTTSTYGTWRINGARNSWNGITFAGSSSTFNTLMSKNNGAIMGLYNDTDDEWYLEGVRGSHLYLYFNGVVQAQTNDGYFVANNQMRSPIYYDNNDTAYYLNPNGQSHLGSVDFSGILSGTQAGCAKVGRNHAYDTLELKGYGAEMMIGGQHQVLHINYRTCNNGATNHTPQTWYWRDGTATGFSNHEFDRVTGHESVRSPIFYDSNDTNYYLNPASTSNLNDVEIVQAAIDAYVYHKGDTDTYFGFSGANSMKFVAGGTERLAITGDVHIQGTTDLNINGTSRRLNFNAGTGTVRTTTANNLIFQTDSTTRFTIANSGTVTATGDVVAYSDERLKTNIETLDGSKVYEMRGVSFTKDDKEGSGVIAQELEKVAPELVNNDSEYKSVAYGNITGYLIEAIKELKAEIEELKCKCDGCTR